MNYTSKDKQYVTNSRLNLSFYEQWTSLFPSYPLISEANMATILKYSPARYSPDSYEELITRRFKADFLILPTVIVEIQGGTFMAKSAHNTGKGLANSFEKLNIYTELGFKVFQLDTKMIVKDWLVRIQKSL